MFYIIILIFLILILFFILFNALYKKKYVADNIQARRCSFQSVEEFTSIILKEGFIQLFSNNKSSNIIFFQRIEEKTTGLINFRYSEIENFVFIILEHHETNINFNKLEKEIETEYLVRDDRTHRHNTVMCIVGNNFNEKFITKAIKNFGYLNKNVLVTMIWDIQNNQILNALVPNDKTSTILLSNMIKYFDRNNE